MEKTEYYLGFAAVPLAASLLAFLLSGSTVVFAGSFVAFFALSAAALFAFGKAKNFYQNLPEKERGYARFAIAIAGMLFAILALIAFFSMSVIAKPAIYLYPEKETQFKVQVITPEFFIASNPLTFSNSWAGKAFPNGTLHVGGKPHEYLFYETTYFNKRQFSTGAVVKKEELPVWLENRLSQAGLNELEKKAFLEYWLPKLGEKNYYFVHFLEKSELQGLLELEIYPKPDSVLRVIPVFTGTDQPFEPKVQALEKIERKGFVAVEWGGILQ